MSGRGDGIALVECGSDAVGRVDTHWLCWVAFAGGEALGVVTGHVPAAAEPLRDETKEMEDVSIRSMGGHS